MLKLSALALSAALGLAMLSPAAGAATMKHMMMHKHHHHSMCHMEKGKHGKMMKMCHEHHKAGMHHMKKMKKK